MVEIALNAFAVFLNPLLELPGFRGVDGVAVWTLRAPSPSVVQNLSKGGRGATAEPACPDHLWQTSRIWKRGRMAAICLDSFVASPAVIRTGRHQVFLPTFPWLFPSGIFTCLSLARLFVLAVDRCSEASLLFSALQWLIAWYLYRALS